VQQNAGKRNVCVDLKAEGSVERVLELAKHAAIGMLHEKRVLAVEGASP
jgi:hypothetical protein